LLLSEAVRRVARVIDRRVLVLPAPFLLHRILARVFELTMRVPLVARASAYPGRRRHHAIAIRTSRAV
jgi:hypothetical protein